MLPSVDSDGLAADHEWYMLILLHGGERKKQIIETGMRDRTQRGFLRCGLRLRNIVWKELFADVHLPGRLGT